MPSLCYHSRHDAAGKWNSWYAQQVNGLMVAEATKPVILKDL